eukprot:3853957-Rhodomonas_salina.1
MVGTRSVLVGYQYGRRGSQGSTGVWFQQEQMVVIRCYASTSENEYGIPGMGVACSASVVGRWGSTDRATATTTAVVPSSHPVCITSLVPRTYRVSTDHARRQAAAYCSTIRSRIRKASTRLGVAHTAPYAMSVPDSTVESIAKTSFSSTSPPQPGSTTHPEINYKITQSPYNLYEECVFLCLISGCIRFSQYRASHRPRARSDIRHVGTANRIAGA